LNTVASLSSSLDETVPWIRNAWGAGIGNERYLVASAKPGEKRWGLLALVVLMKAGGRGPDIVAMQENRGMARVFSRDQVNFLEDPDGPESDVFEVPDRGRNDVERG
jgi:hypothetical protein